MRIAYADPPYPKQARKHYACPEVTHEFLIRDLCEQFPDGWALSTSSPALKDVLSLCPSDVRIGAWVKPFAIFKPGVNPAYTWEPVIYRGGRGKRARTEPTVRDFAIEEPVEDCVKANITLKKGLCGAKPPAFCHWLFRLMGMSAGDEFVDLFVGTGAVSAAWAEFERGAA